MAQNFAMDVKMVQDAVMQVQSHVQQNHMTEALAEVQDHLSVLISTQMAEPWALRVVEQIRTTSPNISKKDFEDTLKAVVLKKVDTLLQSIVADLRCLTNASEDTDALLEGADAAHFSPVICCPTFQK